jgi:hypothetical protein
MNYFGSKSLDAEIFIDFQSGEIRMDYSSNSFHSPYESNSTYRKDKSEWFNLPKWKRVLIVESFIWPLVTDGFVGIAMSIVTFLTQHKLFPAKWQYHYQNFLKKYYSFTHGVYHEEFEGELSGTILQVPVDKNIWFQYELSEDYEKYISKISFERRLRTFKKFNRWDVERQDGWMLTFEFTQPPKIGKCIVEYT